MKVYAALICAAAGVLMAGCGSSMTHVAAPADSMSTSSTAASPVVSSPATVTATATVASCLKASLRVQGGRQGGGFQTAHADVTLTNTGSASCRLQGLPKVRILNAGGATLPVRQTPAAQVTLAPVVLTAHSGTAGLILAWSNWCHGKLGPLTIAVTLPGAGGAVRGPFTGPPGYDYVPGCVAPHQPSTIQVLQSYGQQQ